MKDAALTIDELTRLRSGLARVAYARLLGIELESAERGAVVFRMSARSDLEQIDRIMHGGAIASLVDTASAFAVLSLLEAGQTTATVDLTIHYLRPVRDDAQLKAHAHVLRAGRRIVTVSIEVMNEHGELTATALTTYARKG
ncbi:MAG TPA: PaaI family thioesterase [Pyrinomonadaceae bacterium]